jgi:PRTRC genetic system protein C
MSGLTLEAVRRSFKLGNRRFSDPNPNLSPDQVRSFLQASYPELANAAIHGPTLEGKTNVYVFKVAVGTKG